MDSEKDCSDHRHLACGVRFKHFKQTSVQMCASMTAMKRLSVISTEMYSITELAVTLSTLNK